MFRRRKRTSRRLVFYGVIFCSLVFVMLKSWNSEETGDETQIPTLPRTNATKIKLAKAVHIRSQQTEQTSNTRKVIVSTAPAELVYVESHLQTKGKIMAGVPRNGQAFLVIGVPTVKRNNASYLTATLRDLVYGLNGIEKTEVLIVVFVTDQDDSEHAKQVASEVEDTFPSALRSGLIRVITAPSSYYPKLVKLPLLWNDKPARVKWRSKQCLDYAFLFGYAGELGKYYIQIEDDVIVIPGYLDMIKEFIATNQNRRWLFLEFGNTGFIGMLCRGLDTRRLSAFFKMYYWVHPIDFLFRHFSEFELYGNPTWLRHTPPLFTHIGQVSSLDGQIRALAKNERDALNKKQFRMDSINPPARLSTTMNDTVRNTKIDVAYSKTQHGIFWARTVTVGDYILIEFEKPTRLDKVIIETGSSTAPQDTIGGGKVEIGQANSNGSCEEFRIWGEFEDEKVLIVKSADTEGVVCKCLRIVITGVRRAKNGQARWLVIREIAIWSKKR